MTGQQLPSIQASEHFEVVSTTELSSGNFITLSDRIIKDKDGNEYSRDLVKHPGAVAAVPLTDDGQVYMVRQYRACVDGNMWEIPAGKRDVDGEAPELTAARELEEEAGLVAGNFEPLCDLSLIHI